MLYFLQCVHMASIFAELVHVYDFDLLSVQLPYTIMGFNYTIAIHWTLTTIAYTF